LPCITENIDTHIKAIISIARWIDAKVVNSPESKSTPTPISAIMTASDKNNTKVHPKNLSSISAHLKLSRSNNLDTPEKINTMPSIILKAKAR
jgi:hypothetical protein